MELRKEYSILFNTVTDAIEQLNELAQQLIAAQQAAEEAYISAA
ncbi:MAG: hypothetical protein PHS97_05460 [Oscillospiraceae bacterium]|nr:hypothetical protein [Oscillospiraceae bacterium]